jgi:hypothetical protein
MEFKKPLPYNHQFEKAVEDIKEQLTISGTLRGHPEEYHNKIAQDTILLIVIGQQGVETDGAENTGRTAINQNLISGYYTLLKVSHYTIDVENYITAFFDDFNEMMEGETPSMGGLLLKTLLPLSGVMDAMIKHMLEIEFLRFITKYTRAHWPDVMEQINAMSHEQSTEIAQKMIEDPNLQF